MKQKKKRLLLGMGMLLLAGCGAKDQTATFTLKEEDENVTVENTYKEDDLLKQKVTTVIQYQTMGVATKAKAEELLKPTADLYTDKQGIKQTITYEEKEAVEIVEINLKNVDEKKLKTVALISLPKEPVKQASEKANEEQLVNLGFKKEK